MTNRTTRRPKGGKDKNYEIGYCKPPKHSQFQPGRSGNPAGRRKGVRNFMTDIQSILALSVRVKENGRTRIKSTQEAVLMVLREKALRGDQRAVDALINLALRLNNQLTDVTSAQVLSTEDEAILSAYVAECLASASTPPTANVSEPPPGAVEAGTDDQKRNE